MFRALLAVIALSCWSFVLSEVTVLTKVQILYDKSPKLRIRGSGFDAEDKDILLEIGSTGRPSLVAGKDYALTGDEDGDGVILKLLTNKRWVDLSDRVPPVALVLKSVKFASNANQELLAEPVVVAQVLATPSVEENDLVLYQTASNELRINGTGFIGAKKVDLYFDPPLVKEVAYEDVSKYPLSKNQVVLRLRHGYEWRETPGPLVVLGVDTGGGPVKVGGDEGVEVADVEEDMDEHSVSVEDTADTQLIYADQSEIIVKGQNFNPLGNQLRWGNGLLGNGVNYTTVETTTTKLKLRLEGQSHWRKNFDNLPGTLTLIAVNAGGGFVAVGPINSGKGCDVATVFERPTVLTNPIKVFRTQSHELHVRGSGFPEPMSGFKPQFRFLENTLTEGRDYTVKVISRTEVEITLKDDGAWSAQPGPLVVSAINTRGDSAGWVMANNVKIAEVVADQTAETSGGIQIFPMGVKVYQSAKQQSILITGNGFVQGMGLTFEPALKAGTDYTLTVLSEHQLQLELIGGRKWRADAGLIVAKKVTTPDKKEFALAGKDGIRVAVVLADPVIRPSSATYHESQSKIVKIEGSGFTTVTDTVLMIRPSAPEAYKIMNVLEDTIRVQLQPEKDWLPSFMSLAGEPDKKVELQVASIDTGAGLVVFPSPVTIGYVVQDREGVVCDDSCEFAFDGVCDDGSDPHDPFYYEHYGGYADDDLGGFQYGDDGVGRRKLQAGRLLATVSRTRQQAGKSLRGRVGRRQLQGLDDDEGTYGNGYYDDYYMENEDYAVAPCVEGTDCTDCGGVDAIIDYNEPLPEDSGYETCTNTCMYPRDGICDDPRGSKYCELGTDCQDCGPVGASNFTRSDDDEWWDDDDDYWNFNDAEFLKQTAGLDNNRHKVRRFKSGDDESAASMFLIVLEGMVYTVGAIFGAAALYLLHRWFSGQSIPFLNGFNSELSVAEFEMRPTQRMPVTPDEFRT